MAPLYVVATPLGNLEDLSPRARRLLGEADWVACEDTRRTGRLMSRLGLERPLLSYHEHNEEQRTPQLVERLQKGESGALASDAGTPLISDPGYRLVRACRRRGLEVLPVPGPSAAAAALSVAGLPSDSFRFEGFLPAKASAQQRRLEELAPQACTLIFYLSPHRLEKTLRRVSQALGERLALLGREMTKLHETYYWGTLEEILKQVRAETPRGEYTLVVEGAPPGEKEPPPIDVRAYVCGLEHLRGLSRKDAIRRAAQELGLRRRDVYQTVHSG